MKYGRRINIEAKKKETAMLRKHYQEYKRRATKIIKEGAEQTEIKSFKVFKATLIDTRKKGESINQFVSRFTARSFNRLTKSEAMRIKKALIETAKDDPEAIETYSNMKLSDFINDPSKQHDLYVQLKNDGMTTAEIAEYWKQNIIGSD